MNANYNIPVKIAQNWEAVSPHGYSQAPLAERLANIAQGHESFFSDSEAASIIPQLREQYTNVNIKRECPHEGYTRISAW